MQKVPEHSHAGDNWGVFFCSVMVAVTAAFILTLWVVDEISTSIEARLDNCPCAEVRDDDSD